MIHQITISVRNQSLCLVSPLLNKRYSISTAANGVGQLSGSNCTPLGLHLVKDKFGYQLPLNTVFVGRRAQPEFFSAEREREQPDKDWILGRILWLSGCEPGVNRLGRVDTKRRYIYIHGTPDSQPMGLPASHGCIRMRLSDVSEVFDHTPLYTQVIIEE